MRRLRAIRMRRFLTQKGLAAQLGVPFFTVQRWESGAAFPQARHLEKLCAVLGVGPDELVEPDEWPQPRRAKTRVAA
jgi:transcriptional regulator with XRE-family HTH domain